MNNFNTSVFLQQSYLCSKFKRSLLLSKHLEKRKFQHILVNALETSKFTHLIFRQILLGNHVHDYVIKNIIYHILPTTQIFEA